MGITTLSNHEFDEDIVKARQASVDGPVFITDDGERTHVLLSIDEYRRITGNQKNLVEALSMPGLSDIDLDAFIPAREKPKPYDFD